MQILNRIGSMMGLETETLRCQLNLRRPKVCRLSAWRVVEQTDRAMLFPIHRVDFFVESINFGLSVIDAGGQVALVATRCGECCECEQHQA